MSHVRTRGVARPLLALLILLALAHNWAGITDAYFGLWNWVGVQFGQAITSAATGS